jgi:maltooligosyltrehalose trehalohydrolase
VNYLQNHDQIANSARGERLNRVCGPGRMRALTSLLLLGPSPALLFQGQEFGATTPFRYFADHNPEIAAAVRAGRRNFLTQFQTLATAETQARLPDPADPHNFECCKLRWEEAESSPHVLALHRDLIALSRADHALRNAGHTRRFDGAVLSDACFLLRFFDDAAMDRLLIVNLGPQLMYSPVREPLLAPPVGCTWHLAWSSEHPSYGGKGTPPLELPNGWRIPADSAVFLKAERR